MSVGSGIDPVTLTIINNSFVNICREMGITMMRTAFSPIFNEGLDFSCVLFDRHGNMIGQAEFCPAQVAASLFIVRWTVEELGLEAFEPGDVVLHNDPYRGGAHIPEHSVIRPVFYGATYGSVGSAVRRRLGRAGLLDRSGRSRDLAAFSAGPRAAVTRRAARRAERAALDGRPWLRYREFAWRGGVVSDPAAAGRARRG